MQTFRQYITELFDKGFNWEWVKQVDGQYQAEFETEQNYYRVEIGATASGWYIDFMSKNKDEKSSKGYSATVDTKENVSNKVMATVLSIIEDFINIKSPNILIFEAEKNKLGRASFYDKMLQKILPDNYRVKKEDSGSMTEFTIKKKK